MPTIETAIRLIVIGQELLIAAVFLFGSGGRAARFSGALLVLSVVGYLFTSSAVLRNLLPMVIPAALLLALIVPYCLWFFARAIFEAPWPKPALVIAFAAIVIVVWRIYLSEDALIATWKGSVSVVVHIVALAAVADTLWLALKGRPDDLIERRRSFRLLLVAIVSIQVAIVLTVELALGEAMLPAWVGLTNVIAIALLTVGLAIPILRLDADFFELGTIGHSGGAEHSSGDSLGAAERVMRQKLLDLMEEGVYRETGLSIRALAEKLDYPEHQLRRLINGHLGYRNFSAFLNNYRINEAKERLADAEFARRQVLTIAVDLGYASLGPFNRAFKAATGTTPTDYRKKYSGQTGADSE